ncbi:MAG: hypothetical protein L6R38_008107 [Xanthoria sp. 2 TBL-2021]|nr:MAG: hypothetical protein L6R38_008107 [Xanthoria sp. 2 TBL-2021]
MYSTILMTVSLLATLGTASPPVGAPDSFLKRGLPIYKASFTWNNKCGDHVACGPGAAAPKGIGSAAINTLAFNNPNGAIDGEGNIPYVYGAAGACGACWHLQPQSNRFPSNGKSLGTPIVVKINDECPDDGYCDQTKEHPTNTGGYDAPVHFDLCSEGGEGGAAQQFFGEIGPGVVMGLAQFDPDCAGLHNGPFGSGAGTLQA